MDDAAGDKGAPLTPVGLPTITPTVLTPEEMSDVTEHINRLAVAPNDACPVCGKIENYVAPNVYHLDVQTNPASIGGDFQPLYSTVCHGCGYVRFFNQILVKLLIEAHRAKQAEGPDGG